MFNIQEDLKAWGIENVTLPCERVCKFTDGMPTHYEKLSIAGLLWDFHHGNGECETVWSTMYAETCNNIQLSSKQIFGIFQNAKTQGCVINNLHELYTAVYSNLLIDQKDVNMTFINHGIYNNSLGDFIQGRGDPIGYTGDPLRHVRFTPHGSLMARWNNYQSMQVKRGVA